MTDEPIITTRRRRACGWPSCKLPSFAHRDATCPHCLRPKEGPLADASKGQGIKPNPRGRR